MTLNRKVSGRAMSAPGGIAAGIGVCVLVTVIGALILAWLMNSTYLPESGAGYGAMLTLLAASLAGSMLAAGLVKRQRLLICMITGGVFLLLLLAMTAFCFGGQYQGIVPTVILISGGSAAASLLGTIGQGNRTPRRHKRRYG